jgi:DNA-binding IclR family transcriptional regulator
MSLSDKIVILDKMKAQPAGTSQRRLAELLDLPKSSIARLAAQEQSLRRDGRLRKHNALSPGRGKEMEMILKSMQL